MTTSVESFTSEREGVRELRLAVVCYGGVSLAIYMHGVTKELHKLVLASAALEQNPDENPFPPDSTERVYWDLLARIAAGETGQAGAGMRVVVDVISGTSAGGINGVYLAKALACNASQDALRQLWFEKGDIKQLLRGWRRVPAPLRAAWLAYRSLRRPLKASPPLRGDDMCRWLHGALSEMDGAKQLAGRESLVPADHDLELFVPVTDFAGYDRQVPLYDPRFVRDRTHRHVMSFRHRQGGESQLGREFNHVLAFAARATSSFPGAFPPVSFADYEGAFGGGADLSSRAKSFFPLHALARAHPERAHFIDGGVLDNFPFQSAIDAVAAKPAATEVDRRLVYIEPDPGEDGSAAPDGKAPGLYRTVFGGYAAIPRKEPILDDLLKLAHRNEAVLRVRDVIEASFESVSVRVDEIFGEALRSGELDLAPSGERLAAFRAKVEVEALEEAGFNAATYLRVRIRSMVESYGRAVSQILDFPPASPQASFVTTAMRQWAAEDGLLAQQPDEARRHQQAAALSALDLDYHQRRVRFLVAAVSWLYRDVGSPGVPTRSELDQAKGALYGHLSALQAVVAELTRDPRVRAMLSGIFSDQETSAATGEDELWVGEFVARHRDELVAVRGEVEAAIAAHLPSLEEGLHHDLLAFLERCGESLRGALLTRYVGFPFWDVLVFPLQAMSGVGERDHVEVYRMSPRDVSLLSDGDSGKGKALKGMTLFHFGAFFSRKGRESDYLWGRLDGAERLIKLLLDVKREPTTAAAGTPAGAPPSVGRDQLAQECLPAFEAILAEEAPSLGNAGQLVEDLRARVRRLGS